MATLRGGLFGCGMISEFHLRAWQRIPEVEIVALGNRTIERAEERRAQFAPQARVYDNLTTLLDAEHLDFIDILTPPAVHMEHCLLAKKVGLHIICQKPLCDNLNDARKLVSVMEDYPKLFAIHENHRYRPWFRRIVQLLDNGFFGTPHLLRLEHHNPTAPAESYKLQTEQGIILEYGTHLIDMMRCVLGEPQRVYARTYNLNSQVAGESLAHIVCEYPHTTAIVDIAWKRVGLLQGSLLLEGENAEAYYEGTMTRGEASRFRVVKDGTIIADESRSPTNDYVESFYLFERECVNAMLGDGAVAQIGVENLKTLIITFAAYEAARRGCIVQMADFDNRHR